jgi:hypothetical protein
MLASGGPSLLKEECPFGEDEDLTPVGSEWVFFSLGIAAISASSSEAKYCCGFVRLKVKRCPFLWW